MRKIIILALLAAVLLSACGTPNNPPSDSDLATKVAELLTEMPTETGQPGGAATLPPAATATEQPKEIQSTPTPEPITPTVIVITATPTASQVPPTATLAPTEAPTATQAGPTPTAIAGDPRTRLGNPGWRDPMDSDNNWPTGSDKYTAIDFKDGQLLLTGLEQTAGWRLTWPELTDFYLEMTVKSGSCTGNDQYGFIFRVPEPTTPDQGYLIGLTCDGHYFLRKWDGETKPKGTMTTLINYTTNSAIKGGSGQTNRLGIMAVGSRLIVYINGVMLGEAKDTQFTKGNFGLFVYAKETDNFVISVDEVSYWENPTP